MPLKCKIFKLKPDTYWVVYAKTFAFHHLLTKDFLIEDKDLCIIETKITARTKLRALSNITHEFSRTLYGRIIPSALFIYPEKRSLAKLALAKTSI